eukprot:SAG11_NODE_1229_length_5462_cov_12.053888_4_plen_80_part_00
MNQADFRKMLFAKKDGTGGSGETAPAAAPAGDRGRGAGTVKTYNVAKGFGFIIPDSPIAGASSGTRTSCQPSHRLPYES